MISVIIPTCDRAGQLHQCLNQLRLSLKIIGTAPFEVIVTDDSNTEVTGTRLSFPWVKWVQGPQKGPAANRNNGARWASGKWLLFIDDDCLPSVDLLLVYQKFISLHPHTLVFEGCIKPDKEQKSFIEESPINLHGGLLWSCNFLINRDFFFTELQGFDENFPSPAMEDVDLHYRIRKKGITVLFVEKASVIHPWRRQKHLITVTIKRFTSTLYFLEKHPEKIQEINSQYYLRAFYNGLVRNTLRNAFKYRFNGVLPKIAYDFLQLSFAVYVAIKFFNHSSKAEKCPSTQQTVKS